jgi:acetyl esterase/lipase
MAAEHEPILASRNSWETTLFRGAQVWLFKAAVKTITRIWPSSAAVRPSYERSYPSQPVLKHRFFIPPTCASEATCPLLIDIHGGGFAAFDAQDDDDFCSTMAQTHSFVVVSLSYRLAPKHPFPAALHDIERAILEVLEDDQIPYDHSSPVSLCGFSAGGNLALSVAQLPSIRTRIQKVAPMYPLTDFSERFRGPPKPTKAGAPDTLMYIVPVCAWGYVCPGQDLTNPLLSPVYADRNQLSQELFVVTAECDFLRHEARALALRLSGRANDDYLDGSEMSWEHNRVKYQEMPDQQHGFTHLSRKGEEEKIRAQLCVQLYSSLASWIKD